MTIKSNDNVCALFWDLNDDELISAPCIYGEIVVGHACYCHHTSDDAPRKCPIYKWGEDWNVKNCKLFEENVILGEKDYEG